MLETILACLYLIAIIGFILFGLHRALLLYTLYKFNKQKPTPKEYFKDLPKVTIQLPVYNEKYVVERLIKSAIDVSYPKKLLEIQVLDDSTDETCDIVNNLVEQYQKEGFDIVHIRRPNRNNYKAGALQNGLEKAKSEFLAIFDADFIIPQNFLTNTVNFFTDKNIGMIQGRWQFVNGDYSMLTRVQELLLNAHFLIEHFSRNRSGKFFNFNGTAGIWRKECIENAGGWSGESLTEDLDLSYRAQLNGWKFLFLRDTTCPSELPPNIRAFKAQQFRWMKGMTQVSKTVLPNVLKADLPFSVKLEAFFHLTSPIIYLITALFFVIIFPAKVFILGKYGGKLTILFNIFLGVSLIILFSFYYTAEKLNSKKVNKFTFLKKMIFVIMLGIGNSINASKAIIEGFWDKYSEFHRTPKYGIESRSDTWKNKKYYCTNDGLLYIETFMLVYYLVGVFLSFYWHSWSVVPWMCIFCFGWLYLVINQIIEQRLMSKK
jgi:cellulose synthase/poly-beta-1,6-N-acetylglucosamine synthase-like glycosyltransferase